MITRKRIPSKLICLSILLSLLLGGCSPSQKSNSRESSIISVDGVKQLKIGQVYSMLGGYDVNHADGGYLKLIDQNHLLLLTRTLSPRKANGQYYDPTLNVKEIEYLRKNGNYYFGGGKEAYLRFASKKYVQAKISYDEGEIRAAPAKISAKGHGNIYLFKGRYVVKPSRNLVRKARGTLPNSIEEFLKQYRFDPTLKPNAE